MRNRVLVTGATGFVGRHVCACLAAQDDWMPVAGSRWPGVSVGTGVEMVATPALGADSNWTEALGGVFAVVHAAARAHVMKESAVDPMAEFRRCNVEGTLELARQAAEAGVRRFVFLSSIGVLGRSSERPLRFDDSPAPEDDYAVSKWEAEQGLVELSRETGMEVVVVRPPLVYGPNAPGNFGKLMEWMARGVPLPLGAVTRNRRSLVGLDNLVDLLVTCLEHPAAANRVFLAGDGEDLSTTDLLRRVAAAMGRRARLVPVPPVLLRAGARAVGRGEMARRLLDSLQVDISHTRETLGWEPPVSVDEGLRRAVVPLVG
ncbi:MULTISPECIES: NAD-dependent epimerase/dehydratase family protein [unclassified Thioalkalivibrio]|uniref:NAD-dependent epimerase/dehydratase family protein n=1 Tax=unclassified Thioalkalivibrio TaxID=2621013 RepID=UPI0012DEF12E|nr:MULTISPECIES: NAD-dependent epimerase/dehydratase family protein [unclassified Thioalkalivibrio]